MPMGSSRLLRPGRFFERESQRAVNLGPMSWRARLLTTAGGPQQEGYLKNRSVSVKTLRVYPEAVRLFYLFCRSVMMPTATYQELDVAMEQYLHKLYFDGKTISRPNSTVHGLVYELNLTWSKTSEIPLIRKALLSHRRSSCSVSRLGAPWECAVSLAGFMARHALVESIQAACLALLMFDTYRRISEAVALGFFSLIVAPRELGKPTKAGTNDDTVLVGETAPERRPVLRAILVQILRATKPGEYPFPDLTAPKYGLMFRRACQALGFGDLKLCPRSLRHGGASVDALNGVDTLTIQRRWNVIASCRRYEKKGRILKQLAILGQDRVQESADELAWLVSSLSAFASSRVQGSFDHGSVARSLVSSSVLANPITGGVGLQVELAALLAGVNLASFVAPLARLGVETRADLRYVTEEDLEGMSMTVIQRRKFKELADAAGGAAAAGGGGGGGSRGGGKAGCKSGSKGGGRVGGGASRAGAAPIGASPANGEGSWRRGRSASSPRPSSSSAALVVVSSCASSSWLLSLPPAAAAAPPPPPPRPSVPTLAGGSTRASATFGKRDPTRQRQGRRQARALRPSPRLRRRPPPTPCPPARRRARRGAPRGRPWARVPPR
ncbi:unnamed protein product [Prorocentrum cordatum]|uniref:Uncharacterized protein n=1 Tax=Prorocentrum cordatum TaxID=2364126 RepID=A0ABN9TD27_9DINO|nr:unnamed protein product [Polarella glacialis]